jgi:hypothetical protein
MVEERSREDTGDFPEMFLKEFRGQKPWKVALLKAADKILG